MTDRTDDDDRVFFEGSWWPRLDVYLALVVALVDRGVDFVDAAAAADVVVGAIYEE